MHRVTKPIKERNREAIERKLRGMGDYVKMSYLQRALHSDLDFDTRKFVLLRLAGIFEDRTMFLEAAKLVKGAAEINTTFKDKMNDYMKSVELYIKGGNFDESDLVFKQALALASHKEREELKLKQREFYKTHAKQMFQEDKRSLSKDTYERLLTMDLNFEEKKEIQQELLKVYDKLGLVSEYYALKRSMQDFAL